MSPNIDYVPKLAIIGGSGLYHLSGFQTIKEVQVETPWGSPSDKILIGQFQQFTVAFLARHGRGHHLSPGEIPSRANIAALKNLGVQVIIAFSAVGSLREEIKPCDFILPDQLIDRKKSRPVSFFENGLVAHCSFGDPFDSQLSEIIYECKGDIPFHRNKTLVVMEGPAFSTRAESNLYRTWGCDIINMSSLPEAKLAREAEISYQMVGMATDYDAWKTDEMPVDVAYLISNLNQNGEKAKELVTRIIPLIYSKINKGGLNALKGTMKSACVTHLDSRNREQVKKLDFILDSYY